MGRFFSFQTCIDACNKHMQDYYNTRVDHRKRFNPATDAFQSASMALALSMTQDQVDEASKLLRESEQLLDSFFGG